MVTRVRIAGQTLLGFALIFFGVYLLLLLLHRVLLALVLTLVAAVLAAAMMPHRALSTPAAPLAARVAPAQGSARAPHLRGRGGRVGHRRLLRLFRDDQGDFPTHRRAPIAGRGHHEPRPRRRAGGGSERPFPRHDRRESSRAQGLLGQVVVTARMVVEGVVFVVVELFYVLFVALFMVVESENIMDFWVHLFPPKRRERVHILTVRSGEVVGRWLLGQGVRGRHRGHVGHGGGVHLPPALPGADRVLTMLLDLAPMLGPGAMTFPVFFMGWASHGIAVGAAAALVFWCLSHLDERVLAPHHRACREASADPHHRVGGTGHPAVRFLAALIAIPIAGGTADAGLRAAAAVAASRGGRSAGRTTATLDAAASSVTGPVLDTKTSVWPNSRGIMRGATDARRATRSGGSQCRGAYRGCGVFAAHPAVLVRGEMGPDSDLDVLVVMSDGTNHLRLRYGGLPKA